MAARGVTAVDGLVAGVDGCRAGWVVARLGPDDRRPHVRVEADLGSVAAELAAGDLVHVALDMPVGLPDAGPRPCDVAARRLLGPRRASVFPAPARCTLGATSYADALARSRAATGVGLSLQSYHLLPRIAEAEATVRRVGQDHLTETHPELAFAELAGAPLARPKRDPAGAAARAERLAAVFGDLGGVLERPPRGARRDDVADACALAWSARRLARGIAHRLGGELDGTGLRMEVAW